VVDAFKLLLKFVFYALISEDRGRSFRMMSKGLWHGVLGRAGELSK